MQQGKFPTIGFNLVNVEGFLYLEIEVVCVEFGYHFEVELECEQHEFGCHFEVELECLLGDVIDEDDCDDDE
ncbi:hypothetical protein Tco_1337856 [Tanacetum coccineum]